MSAWASVVVPAYDEEARIAGTLATLTTGVAPGGLDVVVVCNGCTDATADVVRAGFPDIRVIELAEGSKTKAVAAGNEVSGIFPRLHLDADVSISGDSVRALADALREPGVEAVAPTRVVDHSRSPWLVRAYYDVWARLPQVREGLFGRGVFMLSEEGQRRVDALPPLLSDDLAVSEAFTQDERRVVPGAVVFLETPRTTADLLRRRVRAVTGIAQADRSGHRGASAATSPRTLLRLVREDPSLASRLPVFLALTAIARLRARRAIREGDFTTWLRDESTR